MFVCSLSVYCLLLCTLLALLLSLYKPSPLSVCVCEDSTVNWSSAHTLHKCTDTVYMYTCVCMCVVRMHFLYQHLSLLLPLTMPPQLTCNTCLLVYFHCCHGDLGSLVVQLSGPVGISFQLIPTTVVHFSHTSHDDVIWVGSLLLGNWCQSYHWCLMVFLELYYTTSQPPTSSYSTHGIIASS